MQTDTPLKRASVAGLAVVGFVALVIVGLWLALWVAQLLTGPGGLGAVATYVGSWFSPGPSSTLAVVPSGTTTIPFGGGEGTSTSAMASSTPATTTPAKPAHTATGPAPVYYRTVETTYPVPGATRIPAGTSNPTYSGLPDLAVSLVNPGYVDSSGTFHASSTISSSDELAAEILVVNLGTNKSGPWTIKVTVPTSSNGAFTHTETMDSLDPNQPVTIDLRLSAGHPRSGTNDITVEVDPDNKIAESNEANNTKSAPITVR